MAHPRGVSTLRIHVAYLRGVSTWRIYVARLGDAVDDAHSPQGESGVQMAVEANHPDRAAVPIRLGPVRSDV